MWFLVLGRLALTIHPLPWVVFAPAVFPPTDFPSTGFSASTGLSAQKPRQNARHLTATAKFNYPALTNRHVSSL